MFAIDYTITLGTLIETLSIVGGGLIFLFKTMNGHTRLRGDVRMLEAEIKKLADVLINMAVTNTRLENVEQDIREMRHWRGFVNPEANRNNMPPTRL